MLATIAAVTVAVIVILAALWYMRRKMREDFDDEATEHIDSGDPDAAHVKGSSSIPIRARASGSEHDREGHVRRNRRNHPHRGALRLRDDSDGLTGGGDVRGPTYHGRAGRRGRRRRYRRRQYGAEIGRVAPRRLRDRERRRTDRVRPDQRQRHGGRHRGQRRCLEYARTRVLGLFRRTKHVAEDATLDGTHRAPGKADQTPDPQHTRSRSARTSGSRGRPNRRRLSPGRGGGLCVQLADRAILRQVRRYERIEPPKGHSTHVAGVDRRGPRKRT